MFFKINVYKQTEQSVLYLQIIQINIKFLKQTDNKEIIGDRYED